MRSKNNLLKIIWASQFYHLICRYRCRGRRWCHRISRTRTNLSPTRKSKKIWVLIMKAFSMEPTVRVKTKLATLKMDPNSNLFRKKKNWLLIMIPLTTTTNSKTSSKMILMRTKKLNYLLCNKQVLQTPNQWNADQNSMNKMKAIWKTNQTSLFLFWTNQVTLKTFIMISFQAPSTVETHSIIIVFLAREWVRITSVHSREGNYSIKIKGRKRVRGISWLASAAIEMATKSHLKAWTRTTCKASKA